MATVLPSSGPKLKFNRLGNRRASVRYRCAPATSGKVLLGECTEYQSAWVIDLSQGGVGLLMARPLAVHTSLTLKLYGLVSKIAYEIQALVAHNTQQSDGDWLVGCQFVDALTSEQVDDLL